MKNYFFLRQVEGTILKPFYPLGLYVISVWVRGVVDGGQQNFSVSPDTDKEPSVLLYKKDPESPDLSSSMGARPKLDTFLICAGSRGSHSGTGTAGRL